MFNTIFTKKLSDTKKKLVNSFKSDAEIIMEIHNTFDTEVDRLLESTGVVREAVVDNNLITKAERLRKLGFTQSVHVSDAKEEEQKLQEIKKFNDNNKELAEAIRYFSFKYPHYKFITRESVVNICKKYGLIFGEVSRYKGTIPDSSIDQMEKFKINESDCVYVKRTIYGFISRNAKDELVPYNINYKDTADHFNYKDTADHYHSITFLKAPFEIVAPEKDFDTRGMELKDFELVNIPVKDPVVLQPVLYRNKKYYLIVCAWGLEANDESVINHQMN